MVKVDIRSHLPNLSRAVSSRVKGAAEARSEADLVAAPLHGIVDHAAEKLIGAIGNLAVPLETRDTAQRARVGAAIEEVVGNVVAQGSNLLREPISYHTEQALLHLAGRHRTATRRARVRELRQQMQE